MHVYIWLFQYHPLFFFRSLVVARGGLKASEASSYIRANSETIMQFNPTHVVLHVGYCDLVPRILSEKPTTPRTVVNLVSETFDLLRQMLPGVHVFLSEPLPHCIAHDGTDRYRDWNARWRSYNKTVRYLRSRNFFNIPFIPHERLWLSGVSAKPEYYNFSPKERWYGLHLNQSGSQVLVEDILRHIGVISHP